MSNPSLQLVGNALYLLRAIVRYNPAISARIVQIPNLVQQLLSLTRCNSTKQRIQHNSEQAMLVWKQCNKCLYWIRQLGDLKVQSQLVKELNYIQIQVREGGTAGGSELESSFIISKTVNYIQSMIIALRQGTKQCNPQPRLLVTVFENLEYEGGNEEIEAHQFHNGVVGNDLIKIQANNTMNNIANAHVCQIRNV
ncbi:MAG: hypothetical protein EZS28_038123 [Streblomastix strix]|uniref:Uncharacterized protein n=1 Tax=Streblomastix strix TaxID=222440 RepID=A0A5J4U8X7_9EUKA|nr:MAG: hypothetical protein EZS28_038123 [Streblomastix strix]